MSFRFPDPASVWTPGDARAILDEWRRSGDSLPAFARRHGVAVARLYWWRRRIRDAPSVTAAPTLSIVPAAIRSGATTVTIRISGEVAVEIANASPSWVAALVAELAGARS
jgi:transposase-like protein